MKRNFAPKRKPVRIKATRPGKLGGPGYLTRPDVTRRKILRKCVRKYSYRSCVGSLVAMKVWGKRTFTVAQLRKIERDLLWMRRTFRPGSSTRNPSESRILAILRNLNRESERC